MREELRFPALPIASANPWLDALFDLQRAQWDALQRWQTLMLRLHQDAIDQWISHWGGGVPIDA